MILTSSRLPTWQIAPPWWLLTQGMYPSEFTAQMDQMLDIRPVIKVEFIDSSGNVTDISSYYSSGGTIEKRKERLPTEIQAGVFDVVLFNHDDYFSEYKSGSLFYGVSYHLSKIRISQGFVTSDGSAITEVQATGYIDELESNPSTSLVNLRCRDRIRALLDGRLHVFPSVEIPVMGGSNVGNGIISSVATKPFKTKNENWTLTCTLGGADGAATFSVVGSTSGNIGTATSGTEFSSGSGAGGIKFTINGGTINWALDDVATFTTKQYPEWTALNPIKIIWSVLTGYSWDTEAQEAFSGLVMSMDHEKSDSNVDINYSGFLTALNDLTAQNIVLTGYAGYNQGTDELILGILFLFIGSIYTDAYGRIKINTYVPRFAQTYRNFSDTKKVTTCGYSRAIHEIINSVKINYKKKDVWDFSDADVIYQGTHTSSSSASIAKYGILDETYYVRWYAANGSHVQDFASKLLGRYAEPPLNINFNTGMDALRTEIGDVITISDVKNGFSSISCEVARITKQFDAEPRRISMSIRRDGNVNINWVFLGSSVDEGDGLSPQELDFDDASSVNLLFTYLGTTATAASSLAMSTTYTGKALPAASTPAWARTVGSTYTEAVSGGKLTVTANSGGGVSGIKYQRDVGLLPGDEFGFIGYFTTVGNIGSGSEGQINIRTSATGKYYAIAIGANGFRESVSSGSIVGDPTVWHHFRFVINADGSLALYTDGVLTSANFGTGGGGTADNYFSLDFSGNVAAVFEKWWYKLSGETALLAPGYFIF